MSKTLQFIQQFVPLVLREHAVRLLWPDRQPAVPLDRVDHLAVATPLRTRGQRRPAQRFPPEIAPGALEDHPDKLSGSATVGAVS